MNIRSIKAWAIVDKEKPKLRALEIYSESDVMLNKNEKMVQVEISVITKKKK